MKSARSKATDISQKTKEKVWERDEKLCVVCHTGYGCYPNSHFIRRSAGGLGIEQNIVTMCQRCHHLYDNGSRAEHERIRFMVKNYLMDKYPDWDEEKLYYKKYGGI